MKTKKLHIIGITGVTAIFTVFTLMHQFNWLIPPSPIVPTTSSTSVPSPDAFEEYGGEDVITQNLSTPIFISIQSDTKNIYMIFEDLFIPQVSTPPPDVRV